MNLLEIGVVGFAATSSLMTTLWIVSIDLEDVSIVDLFWGPAFVLNAATGLWLTGAGSSLRWLMFGVVFVWGTRLALHLAMRKVGEAEDHRYAKMRETHGHSFWWKSLWIVFLFQALLASTISLPIHAVMLKGGSVGVLSLLGGSLAMVGVLIEATADRQLRVFLESEESSGRVLKSGLWRYSRHPNYFGDAVVWWGFGLIALEVGAWYALLGPILMTFLLLRVSGVALLEKTIVTRRPEYEDYIRRTSPFIPWPPKVLENPSDVGRHSKETPY